MKLKNTNRERLLDGTEKLNGQGGQIGRIMDVAVDTHGNMQSANRELKDQRGLIHSANDKVLAANASTNRTKGMVNQMTRKEYWYKFLLYLTIVLLFVADVGYLILKIF